MKRRNPHRVGSGLLTALALIALVQGAGCSNSESSQPAAASTAATPAENPPPEQDAVPVRVAGAVRDELSSLYQTSATLRAEKQATVTARTQGVVRQLLVEEGDRVAAGQELAILENEEQRIEFERAAAARDTVQRELERATKLHEQGMTSDEAFEAIRRDAVETRHTAALAELTLERTVIRAPFAGTILLRHVDAGATVQNGTAVYDLADTDPLYADVTVPERHVAELRPGQTVRLSVDAAGTETAARIERIAPRVDATTGTVKVTLAVPPSKGMRPGSFTRVAIVTDTHAEALVVPRSALVAEGRRWHLFRVSDDPPGATVERLEVTRGYEEGDRVEILTTVAAERPLGPGDRVVVVGASALTDGARIEPIADGDPADGSGRVTS